MKILVGQPVLESSITQLTNEIHNHTEADLFVYPEGYLNEYLKQAISLAAHSQKILLTGYNNPKDRAVIIGRDGTLLVDRAKYEEPKVVKVEELHIGFLLCDELVLQGLDQTEVQLDIIVHPIGVGMFSEEQFEEWLNLAKVTARRHQAWMIGTSHADGSYRNCGHSIPITYIIRPDGDELLVMKNDIRSVIWDTDTLEYEIVNNSLFDADT